MANEVMIPSGSALPAHIQKLMASNPSLLAVNEAAAQGIGGGGSVPTIVANQGVFKTKVDGVEEVIQIQTEAGPMSAAKITAVILRAKPTMDRVFYLTSWSPGQEVQAPDCSSDDGIKPRPDSPNKQCESCAGCPQNQWGTAKKQDGSPGDGKACSERKRLAVFANKGIYKFSVPPASLTDFKVYSGQLGSHGLALPAVVSTISFDPNKPGKLVFQYVNVLNEQQLEAILPLIDGPEVKAIIEDGFVAPAQQQIAAPVQPAGPSEAEKAAEAAAKVAEKKAKDAEAKAAAKKAKEEKEAAEKAAAAAQQNTAGAGLDLDLGGGAAPQEAASGVAPSDADLAALLDL